MSDTVTVTMYDTVVVPRQVTVTHEHRLTNPALFEREKSWSSAVDATLPLLRNGDETILGWGWGGVYHLICRGCGQRFQVFENEWNAVAEKGSDDG